MTPEHEAFCKNLIATHKLHDSVPFSPLTMDSQIARFPGSGGGPEWGGGAFDPKLGYFIVNTNDMGSIEQLEKKPGGYWGSTTGPDSFFIDEDKQLMCQTAALGQPVCGERQHRRDRLAHHLRRHRQPAGSGSGIPGGPAWAGRSSPPPV